jgi:Dolichyl-phosphate-mannose-protein mannosyltransferase
VPAASDLTDTATETQPPRRGRPDPRRHRRWLFPLIVVALLAEMAVAMVTTAVQQTPTIDEPVYVGTAVVYLTRHDLVYNPEHPPLGKLIIAAGAAFVHPRLDPAFHGDEFTLGTQVVYRSGNDPGRLMLAARLPMIALTLLFGLVLLAFARDVAGPAGALVALALYTFSPDLIAHGSLATLDVPAAGFVLTSVWLLWRARRRPRLHLPLAGLALGAALATRMSALPAVPVLLVLAVLSVWLPSRTWRRALLGLAAAAGLSLIAVAVVWLSYLAVDPHLHWVTPADVPHIGGGRGLVTDLLPLPRPYRDGMRIQFGLENRTYRGFLFGRQYRGTLWYYLPAALLVKTPLGMLALWVGGVAALLTVARVRAAAPYVLAPAAVLLAAAMTGARDFGTRYVVILPMLLAVAAATVVTVRWRWGRAGAAALVLFVAVSSLRTFPYYLPYSNEAFGGPAKTYLRLHDANVDWGQDLGRLAGRLRTDHPGEPVWLVYKGSGVPGAYGIHAADPRTVPPDRVHGLLVVSDDSIDQANAALKALIAGSTPIDTVGHSITIFRRP